MRPKRKPLNVIAVLLCLFLLLNTFGQTGIAYAAEESETTISQTADENEEASSGNEEASLSKTEAGNQSAGEEEPKPENGETKNPDEEGKTSQEMTPEEANESETEAVLKDARENAETLTQSEEEKEEQDISSVKEEPADDNAAAAESAPEEKTPVRRALRSAPSSADLADFLVNVDVNAPTDENGNYVIDPNSTYEVTFAFRENEGIQFDNENDLVYDLPEGLSAPNVGATSFDINIVDDEGTVVISGNTFEINGGVLKVRFNQGDANINRLKALANVAFQVQFGAQIDETASSIIFNSDIEKEFVFETNSDLTIDKAVTYDMDTDTASYVITVESYGYNENVSIQDVMSGTALILNRDVTVESSVHGVLNVAVDYDSVEKGFVVNVPSMENNEKLTIRCTATVDNNKISSNGTVNQTKNTARVTSDQVPDGKEANADFAGQADFQRVGKDAVGDPVQIGDNLYRQTWRVRVNEDHKLDMGGNNIDDWIASNSRPFMSFDGDGLTVIVTFENGTVETRNVSWSDLYLWQDGNGGIWGWRYTAPESDGRASYDITCTTLINTNGALGDLTLLNGAQVFGSYDEGKTTVGVIGENVFDIKKEAVGTTSTESEWKITVTVPGSGLSELHVVDDCPKIEGDSNIDPLIDSTMEVEGLLEGESWRLVHAEGARTFVVYFYKSENQSAENAGVLPTADGQPRDIVLHFKTQVDQDWLDRAAENGYVSSKLSIHRNYTSAWSGTYRTNTVDAYVVPVKPEFIKNFAERAEAEMDGVTYPVFRYTITMLGPTQDGIVIQDSFETDYLKYYEAEGIKILGGTSSSATDGNGTISAENTQSGMDITVSSFPKRGDGSFYPYYKISYSLIVKDSNALEALNEEAAASTGGIDLKNTAVWENLSSSRVVNYTYFPYVDKELAESASPDNGYVAEFKVIINQFAEDLDPASDTITVQDELSSNLRLDQNSISVTPEAEGMKIQFDSASNTIIFTDVPDSTRFEITYRARVLGKGNITYSNKVKLGNYEKIVEEEVKIESSGSGTGSNPSITLVKRDSENVSATLAGATFQLFYLSRDTRIPVTDRDGNQVFFTTGADGTVLIAGNQTTLGWTLWEGRTYQLVEITAPAGYEINETPTEFVLSSTPSSSLEYDLTGDVVDAFDTRIKTEVPVCKTWIGPSAESVTVYLKIGETTVQTATIGERNNWQYTFTGLDKYDSDGSEIVYRVEEEPVENYRTEITGDAENGYVINNTNAETIDIPVEKTWIGEPLAQVTVRLLADGVEADSAVLTAEGNWSHEFIGLPKYDQTDGHEIQYDVEEEPIEGYISSREGTITEGFIFINEITGKVSVPVKKNWIGPEVDKVTVNLLADGEKVDSIDLSADNNWQYVFENLEKYKQGKEIKYTIEEVELENYKSEITGDATEGYVINNTNTETIDIPVEKTWVGETLDQVTVRLLADGEEIDSAALTAAEDWKHVFVGLYKYDQADGHEIQYSVTEDAAEGYNTSISGTAADGFQVINTITGQVSFTVTKKWVGQPADSVTIKLLADGEIVQEVTLSADNGWKYLFAGLEQYKDGTAIKYTITEDDIDGYTSEITGSEEEGFTVTNTEEEKPKKDKPQKPSKPAKKSKDSTKTGDNSNVPLWISLITAAGVILAYLLYRKKRENKN